MIIMIYHMYTTLIIIHMQKNTGVTCICDICDMGRYVGR